MDLSTNNDFSFNSLTSTVSENITVNAGSGRATLGAVTGATVNNFSVIAGSVHFSSPIESFNTEIVSSGKIVNVNLPVLISNRNSILLNAQNGDIGTLTSPVYVNTSVNLLVGAGSGDPPIPSNGVYRDHNLANLQGTALNVIPLNDNPPCILIWNGVTLSDCRGGPQPPVPPPTSPSFSGFTKTPFDLAGFISSAFNLSSCPPLYYRTRPYESTPTKSFFSKMKP